MAKRFVRNIRDTKLTGNKKEPLYTNSQNDLLSDGENVFVRNKDKYEQITGKSGGTGEVITPEITFRLEDNGNLYYKVEW